MTNQKTIRGVCKIWTHIKCDVPSAESHCNLTSNNKKIRECSLCCVRFNLENIPFTRCLSNEIININNSNSMKFLEALTEFEIITGVSKFSNLDAFELDLKLTNHTDCKYYTVSEFQNLYLYKNLNIFHSNVNGL